MHTHNTSRLHHRRKLLTYTHNTSRLHRRCKLILGMVFLWFLGWTCSNYVSNCREVQCTMVIPTQVHTDTHSHAYGYKLSDNLNRQTQGDLRHRSCAHKLSDWIEVSVMDVVVRGHWVHVAVFLGVHTHKAEVSRERLAPAERMLFCCDCVWLYITTVGMPTCVIH